MKVSHSMIQEHGPLTAVGFLHVAGQLLTEDYYLFNKLVKGQIGTNNIDTNSRLCMSSAVAGYKQTTGSRCATCLLRRYHPCRAASSSWAATPPMRIRFCFAALKKPRKANPQLKIIFADPSEDRHQPSIADLYLPLLPGTDVMPSSMACCTSWLWEGWIDTGLYRRSHDIRV